MAREHHGIRVSTDTIMSLKIGQLRNYCLKIYAKKLSNLMMIS